MNTNLIAVQMELTNACQLDCAECPHRIMSRKVGVMDLDLAKLLIEEGLLYRRDMGFTLSGLGEPLLYPHLPELIYFMKTKGVAYYSLFTSLSAPTKNVERVFKAISDTGISGQFAITKHFYDGHGDYQVDEDQFQKHFDMALKLPGNVDKHIHMNATKFHTSEFLDSFLKHYRQFLPHDNVHFTKTINPWFNTVKDMASMEWGADLGCLTKSICDYPFILFHVGWDGKVIICCTDDVDEESDLGEIKEKGDLRKIWEGPKLQEIRDKFNNYIVDKAPCTKCERTLWSRPSQDLIQIE
jgi:radical SAM protein with 4Fe4S-binding SPASM domain